MEESRGVGEEEKKRRIEVGVVCSLLFACFIDFLLLNRFFLLNNPITLYL